MPFDCDNVLIGQSKIDKFNRLRDFVKLSFALSEKQRTCKAKKENKFLPVLGIINKLPQLLALSSRLVAPLLQ